MPTWIKPELIMTLLVGICTVAGTALVTWSNGNINAAMRDRDIAEFKRDNNEFKQALLEIKVSLTSIPLYTQRVAQLETWQNEQKGFNGAIDGKLSIMREDLRAVTTDVANIKSASGSRMR